MTYHLAAFQQEVKEQIYRAWADPKVKVVMPVLPTGAGKTVLMGNIAHEYAGFGCSIAHRSELVGQLSVALAREGVRHDIIAPTKTIRTIVNAHLDEIGRSFHDPRAPWKVASVDTLIRRQLDPNWLARVGMVHEDEGHHVLRDNKWGKALAMFPNAIALLPTASPERADGKGLGRHADGLVDVMVEGPNLRWLIDHGHLTDYKVLAPRVDDLDMSGVDISPTTGDYNADQLRNTVKQSNHIVGDVVQTYLKFARGKLGITFAVDVEHATRIADEYNRNGVPAQVVHADTPDADRNRFMRMFKNRELLQLVNVDLFGEGVDVPAVEVVSMARPTASYGLYVQQFGRALRLLVSPILRAAWHSYSSEQRRQFIAESTKPFALIIDHVNNIVSHGGPPDWRTKPWSLDARKRNTKAVDGIPLRACANPICLQPFERIYPACPYCGWEPPPPAVRSLPQHVDGDLVLFTEEMLQALFGQKEKVDGPCFVPYGVDAMVANAIRKNHRSRQEAQAALRKTMALVLPPTVDERINNRRFFHKFGVDTLTAQGLGYADAHELRQRIAQQLGVPQ